MSGRKPICQEPPVIDFGRMEFEESKYSRGNESWMATTLLLACHKQALEPFELPLASIDLSVMRFSVKNTDEFVWQMKRCMDADLNNPIILDDLGQVADGSHRICKALLEGRRTIMAYRLQSMPQPDFVEPEKESDE